jgi:hypothetical protein
MEQLLEAIAPYRIWLIVGISVVVGLVLLRIALALVSRKPRVVDPERHLRENLAEFPPAFGPPGSRQLLIQGVPVRLRLVVLAPAGKQNFVDPDAAVDILNQVAYGLGGVALVDKPRVRVWPPQLSHSGFAPTFHRRVVRPEPEGQPSPWILVAGPARVGGSPVLLGLAGYADKPTTVGRLNLEEDQWASVLRIA